MAASSGTPVIDESDVRPVAVGNQACPGAALPLPATAASVRPYLEQLGFSPAAQGPELGRRGNSRNALRTGRLWIEWFR
jgi:hypothetical protein